MNRDLSHLVWLAGGVLSMAILNPAWAQTSALDTVTTPYHGSHQILMSGQPSVDLEPASNDLVKGGFGGELQANQIPSDIESHFGINSFDLSGGLNLNWTLDLSAIGIDLSPIGGPNWNLGTWGITPVAAAWSGVKMWTTTEFESSGAGTAGTALEMEVDIPLDFEFDIPAYEKGDRLEIMAKSYIVPKENTEDYVTFVNGDFSKEISMDFGAATDVGIDIYLGPFGSFEPRIVDYGFDSRNIGTWSDGITIMKANKYGFAGELGLVARPIWMDLNNKLIGANNSALSFANARISDINSITGNAKWSFGGSASFEASAFNNFMGNTLGMNGGAFDLVGMIADQNQDLSAMYCIYKVFYDDFSFDLPDFSQLLKFDANLNFELEMPVLDEFQLNDLVVNDATPIPTHPMHYDNTDWLTDWAWYNNEKSASFYAYLDEDGANEAGETLVNYSNICMVNNDENDANPSDETALVSGSSEKKAAKRYGFASVALKNSITAGSAAVAKIKPTSMILFKRMSQFIKLPVGRSKASNTNSGMGDAKRKAPSMYKKLSNGYKTYSSFQKYKKKYGAMAGLMILCEPTIDAIDVMEELFSGNFFASSFLNLTGSLLNEVDLKTPSANEWFTTAEQLDMVDNFGISLTARKPTTMLTSTPSINNTPQGYTFRSQTVESSTWFETRHNFLGTFKSIAELYCPVLAPTPPCAALVALEMRKSADNSLLDTYLPKGMYDKSSGKINIWSFSGSSLLGPAQSLIGMIQKANEVIACAQTSSLGESSDGGGALATAASVNNAVINFLDWGMTAIQNLELLNIWMKYNLLDVENKFSLANRFNASLDVEYEYKFVFSSDSTTNTADINDPYMPVSLKDPIAEQSQILTASQLRNGARIDFQTNCADASRVDVYARVMDTKANLKGNDFVADSLLYELFTFDAGIDAVTLIPSFKIEFLCFGSIEDFASSLGSCVAKAVVQVFNWFCKTFGGSKCFKEGKCKTCSYGFPGLKTPEWSISKNLGQIGWDDAINLKTGNFTYLDKTLTLEQMNLDVTLDNNAATSGDGGWIPINSFRVPANAFSMRDIDVFRSPSPDDAAPTDSSVIANFFITTSLPQLTATFQDKMVPVPGGNEGLFEYGETQIQLEDQGIIEGEGMFQGKLPPSVYGEWNVKSEFGCNAKILDPIAPVPLPISVTTNNCETAGGGLAADEKWPDGSDGCYCADIDRDMCNDCANTDYNSPDPTNDGLPAEDEKGNQSDGDYDDDGQCDFGDEDDDNDGSKDVFDPEDFNELILGDWDGDGNEDGWCQDYNDSFPDCSNTDLHDATANCLQYNSNIYVRCDELDFDNDGICDYNDPDADNDGVYQHPNVDIADGIFTAPDINQDGCDYADIAILDTTETGDSLQMWIFDCNDRNQQICYSLDADNCDDCGVTGALSDNTLWGPDAFNDGPDFDRDGICDSDDPDMDNDGVPNNLEPNYHGISMERNPMFCGGEWTTTASTTLPCDSCMQNWSTYAQRVFESQLFSDLDNVSPGDSTNVLKATMALFPLNDSTIVQPGDYDGHFTAANLQALESALENISLISSGTETAIAADKLIGDSLINLFDIFDSPGIGDFDQDGKCNSLDNDWDGDNVSNLLDSDPWNRSLCQDLDLDGCDDCSVTGTLDTLLWGADPANDGLDTDGDGLCDNWELNNDTIPLNLELDVDGDGRLDGRLSGVLDSVLMAKAGLGPMPNVNLTAHQFVSDNGDFISDEGDTYNLNDLFPADASVDQKSGLKIYAHRVQDPRPFDSYHCGDTDGDDCDDCVSGSLDHYADGPNFDYTIAATNHPSYDLDALIAIGADSLADWHWELINASNQRSILREDATGQALLVQWDPNAGLWHDSRSGFFNYDANNDTVTFVNLNAAVYPELKCVLAPGSSLGDPLPLDSVIQFRWDGFQWVDSGDFVLPADLTAFTDGQILTAADNATQNFVTGSNSSYFFNDSTAWSLSLTTLSVKRVYGDIDADGDGLVRELSFDFNQFLNGGSMEVVAQTAYISATTQGLTTITGSDALSSSSSTTETTGFHRLVVGDSLHRYGVKSDDLDWNEARENRFIPPIGLDSIVIAAADITACDLFGVVYDFYQLTDDNQSFANAFVCLKSGNDFARRIRTQIDGTTGIAVLIENFDGTPPAFTPLDNPNDAWVQMGTVSSTDVGFVAEASVLVDSASVVGFEISQLEDFSSADTHVLTVINDSTAFTGLSFEASEDTLTPNTAYYIRPFATRDAAPALRIYGVVRQFLTASSASIQWFYEGNQGFSSEGVSFEDDPNYPHLRKRLATVAINSFDYMEVQLKKRFDLDDQNAFSCFDYNFDGVDDCSNHEGSYSTYHYFSQDDIVDVDNLGVPLFTEGCTGWWKPTYYQDLDGDGYGDPNTSITNCSVSSAPFYVLEPPTDYVSNNEDNCIDTSACNYADPANEDCTYATTWYADTDGDGAGDPNEPVSDCTAPENYVDNNNDSDDNNSSVQ